MQTVPKFSLLIFPEKNYRYNITIHKELICSFILYQGDARTGPERQAGIVGPVSPGTASGTGTAGAVFQEPELEPALLLNVLKHTQRAMRDIQINLSPRCLASVFDLQLPAPKIVSRPYEKALIPLWKLPRGEGNCETTERQNLSRGSFRLATSKCLFWSTGQRSSFPRATAVTKNPNRSSRSIPKP